jgi:hypothetical protein
LRRDSTRLFPSIVSQPSTVKPRRTYTDFISWKNKHHCDICHLILYFQSIFLSFFRQIRRTETFNYIVDSTMDTEGATRDSKTSLIKLEATKIAQLASAIKNCPTCAKEFTSAERLDRHRRAAACSGVGNSGAAYACWLESCERRFVQAAHLENHRLHHVDERRYACQTCYARFAAPASLSLHLTQLHAQVSAFAILRYRYVEFFC